jgi:hypothetical protein
MARDVISAHVASQFWRVWISGYSTSPYGFDHGVGHPATSVWGKSTSVLGQEAFEDSSLYPEWPIW